jgi:hypothetical protein
LVFFRTLARTELEERPVAEYAKPLPTITDRNRPLWEVARQGELRMQRCLATGRGLLLNCASALILRRG